MLYVALAELGLLALTFYGFWGAMRYQQRAHSRREDALLDKVLHATGKPWTPAPADSFDPPKSPYDDEGELIVGSRYARFTDTPEQEP